jgi:hypothetical protein
MNKHPEMAPVALHQGCPLQHCYGPQHGEMTVAVRQRKLMSQYCFSCNCEACKDKVLASPNTALLLCSLVVAEEAARLPAAQSCVPARSGRSLRHRGRQAQRPTLHCPWLPRRHPCRRISPPRVRVFACWSCGILACRARAVLQPVQRLQGRDGLRRARREGGKGRCGSTACGEG